MIFRESPRSLALGLLLLRIAAGSMLAFGHGWAKLASFSERASTFADPIGIGPAASLALAVFAEFFCPLAIILGLLTRLAVLPPIILLLVAGLLVHAHDPWRVKELAFIYLVPFAVLLFTGAGRFALDAVLARRLGPPRA
ncbi:MAG: hypothetical protein A2W00_01210 [Candidatus Eisenbacteria bacterium RBG_16_71_46]|nr:MAG: hypothetical protein A2W00_01210 [Candidatus Eisenbacteria bacterium RBG_16_71_46]